MNLPQDKVTLPFAPGLLSSDHQNFPDFLGIRPFFVQNSRKWRNFPFDQYFPEIFRLEMFYSGHKLLPTMPNNLLVRWFFFFSFKWAIISSQELNNHSPFFWKVSPYSSIFFTASLSELIVFNSSIHWTMTIELAPCEHFPYCLRIASFCGWEVFPFTSLSFPFHLSLLIQLIDCALWSGWPFPQFQLRIGFTGNTKHGCFYIRQLN